MDSKKSIQKAYESILSHDFEQAIEWFDQAIQEDPSNPEHHYKLSITYARSNKLTKAIEHAKKACKIDEKSEKYRFHFGYLQSRCCIKQAEAYFETEEQLHLAVALLKSALQYDPLAVEAYSMLGIACMNLQEYSMAMKALQDGIKLDPQNVQLTEQLEVCKQKFKQYLSHLPGENRPG